MDISGWIKDLVHETQESGVEGFRRSMYPVWYKLLQQTEPMQSTGVNIFDFEWDLLIVIDACRLDLIQETEKDYGYIGDIGTIRSVDTATQFWMRKTFENVNGTNQTQYICGNPFSAEELDSKDFNLLDEVWRYAWTEPGTVPPRAVTDATVKAMRKSHSKRTIAHYMQPHCPFISAPKLTSEKELDRFGDQRHRDIWELYRDGDISLPDLWEGYKDNLRIALDDIQLLLNNVDAEKVVITSDHGNALGKWGVYGHPPKMPHESLRIVPWIETTASDSEDYEPSKTASDSGKISREEQLKSLGYL